MNAFQANRDFEKSISEYTGASFVVVVNSATSALQLALEWYRVNGGTKAIIPERTYRSVANMILRTGLYLEFIDEEWRGIYNIRPSNIWDCALRLKPKMYVPGTVQCLSFHPQKPLALSSGGGAILHDDPEADKFYRLDRFDGREEGISILKSSWEIVGAHCYMFPGQAGEGAQKMEIYATRYPDDAPDTEQPEYENLREKWEEYKPR
ncbi:MAG: DegT/DnrJ/EryC1/StrS family aminotransferase [Dehalococcoidia bacterium]|jgi:dTDP-4-amino-4,6-dideoxygalactose transaminase